ncbi:MAG: DUF2949 domain-containing protein [Cyanobacteriota bacterium]|nr:DUF2949 domain-containing protein [Cyanobacteriota bacterium]
MTFPNTPYAFLNFLRQELSLSEDSLAIAQRQAQDHHGTIPMVLLQYGLIGLEDLERIYDWLEQARPV